MGAKASLAAWTRFGSGFHVNIGKVFVLRKMSTDFTNLSGSIVKSVHRVCCGPTLLEEALCCHLLGNCSDMLILIKRQFYAIYQRLS